MFEIELAITTKSLEDAKMAISNTGLTDADIQSIGSLFIANITFNEELSDHIYKKIEDSDALSIVRDSSSQKRGEQVSESLYKVESHLRRLLLYTPDITESYLDLIAKQAIHYKGEVQISKRKSMDTLTSQLTLGQIINIFDQNTSADGNEALTRHKLIDILSNVTDLESLKERMSNEIKPISVWDVISEHVLKHPVELAKISSKLSRLKDIRDTAAHYRVITPQEVKEALFLSKSLISELEIKQLSADDQEAIRTVDRKAASLIKDAEAANGGYPANLANAAIDTVVDPWGMYNRESVSYAAWKVYQKCQHMPYWGGRGNANQWPANAQAAGIPTGSAPKAQSVAIIMEGHYGHAMWVEEVLPNDKIRVSQYNANLSGTYSEMTIPSDRLIYLYF